MVCIVAFVQHSCHTDAASPNGKLEMVQCQQSYCCNWKFEWWRPDVCLGKKTARSTDLFAIIFSSFNRKTNAHIAWHYEHNHSMFQSQHFCKCRFCYCLSVSTRSHGVFPLNSPEAFCNWHAITSHSMYSSISPANYDIVMKVKFWHCAGPLYVHWENLP